MNETVFESSTGGVDITSGNGNPNEIQCEIKDDTNDPMTMYLSLGRHGDDTYRYYWNKSVSKFSALTVQYADLTEVPPLVTMHFPQGLDFEYLYVLGSQKKVQKAMCWQGQALKNQRRPHFHPKKFRHGFLYQCNS
ncbi:MAG: hypothetical protein IPN76_16455 [Saprospiraceae bacterium]|nr:hypothetical protein [Saprospiraceae bacterium]